MVACHRYHELANNVCISVRSGLALSGDTGRDAELVPGARPGRTV